MIQKIKNVYHLGKAAIALRVNGNPAKGLKIIGVTGTDGKTTTSALLYHILKAAGNKVALVNTVGAIIDDKVFDTGFHTTTPSPFALQKYIKLARHKGCDYLILEVTSHALDQNRVFGIQFLAGILTNITHEHLDYHKTYENYVKTKSKLLSNSKIRILNFDDESYPILSKILKNNGNKTISYSLKKTSSDITLDKFPIKTNLNGDFNVMNCLAAAACAKSIGIVDEVIKKAILSFLPPTGRQEVVFENDFKVIIDFAHTPNALLQILFEVRKSTVGRLIHVFGSAGKRDKSKRRLMGQNASKFDNIIILTAEDPRGEDVGKICEEISEGFDKKFTFQIKSDNKREAKDFIFYLIPYRKEAIEFAISIAKNDDTVLITGKGHEQSMNYGKGETPWSEHDAVSQSLKARGLI